MRCIKRIRRLMQAVLSAWLLASTAQAEPVFVFAAASLKESMDAVAAAFEDETHAKVTLSYAGSSALGRQISRGAPADVFISASATWMDYVEANGRISGATRVDLLGNRMVLIGARPEHGDIPEAMLSRDSDIAGMLAGGRLAMAMTQAVPAGIYGRQALETLGLWDSVAASVAETDNVRAALALVAMRAAPLGIVYATDALAEPRVAVLGVFPADSHAPIVYPAALTRQAEAPEAVAFLAYLESDAARAIFSSYGFTVLGDGS